MDATAQPLGNGNWILVIRRQLTNGQKWLAAVILGILFAIFASPPLWGLANSLTMRSGDAVQTVYAEKANNAYLTLLVLAIVFTLVVRLLMW